MKERITNILLFIIVLLLGLYIYIALRDRGLIEVKVNSAVQEAVAGVEIPKPKDGANATMKQIEEVVTDYLEKHPPKSGENGLNVTDEQVRSSVEEYFKKKPIQPKDGKRGERGETGLEGKTPQINCNVEKNRWEVRYGDKEAWQLLNGVKVPCTVVLP